MSEIFLVFEQREKTSCLTRMKKMTQVSGDFYGVVRFKQSWLRQLFLDHDVICINNNMQMNAVVFFIVIQSSLPFKCGCILYDIHSPPPYNKICNLEKHLSNGVFWLSSPAWCVQWAFSFLRQKERSRARAQFTLTGQPQREDLGSESWIGECIRGVEDIGANRVKELERRGKRKG